LSYIGTAPDYNMPPLASQARRDTQNRPLHKKSVGILPHMIAAVNISIA